MSRELRTQNLKIADIGEFALIERLARQTSGTLKNGVVGPRDDCAILPVSIFSSSEKIDASLLVTSDLLVENRHFRMKYTDAFSLGWKALAVSLSDIAAMGGTPVSVIFTQQLAGDASVDWIDKVYQGLTALAERTNAMIVGGDTVSATETVFGTTILGYSSNPILRSGAKAGDSLWLSGKIGGAFLGLQILEGHLENIDAESTRRLLKMLNAPLPRLELGQFLSDNQFASSLIDISDGLIQDANHIARQSQKVIEIDSRLVPFVEVEGADRFSPIELMTGGEDYELLFTVPQSKKNIFSQEIAKFIAGKLSGVASSSCIPIEIGSVREPNKGEKAEVYIRFGAEEVKPGTEVLEDSRLSSGGFDHFK